jgi:hypothetical protein
MFSNFNDASQLYAKQFEAASAVTSSIRKGWLELATETNDYARQSLEKSRALGEKLMGVTTFDEAFRLHADFAKSASQDFLTQITKVGGLYAESAEEFFKPVAAMMAETPSTLSSRKPSSVPAE